VQRARAFASGYRGALTCSHGEELEVTAGPKACPKCGLLSDPTATTCDCGYHFASGSVRPDAAQPAPKRSKGELDIIIDGAEAYRGLLWLVLVQLVLGVASRIAHRAVNAGSGIAALVALGASVAVLVAAVLAARKAAALARVMGMRSPAGAGVIVLLTGIFGYLWLNAKARAWCRREGVEVGLFGPTPQALDALYRRFQEARATEGAA
jgi:hypothetical protein